MGPLRCRTTVALCKLPPLAAAMGHITILHKGCPDLISNGKVTEDCGLGGSPRRCGGQGDVLSGSLATFLHWASRSADDMIKGYKLNLQQFTGFNKVPNGILNFWFKFQHCRKGLKKAKAAVGTGYSNEEIDAEGKADLKVLSDMLADKEFFFGDEPHSLDLVTFAHLAQIINVESGDETGVKCPLKEYLESDCQNLVGLYNRMKDRAWGEHWEEAIGEKLELNPHIPKPDPPKEEEKKEEEEKAEDKKEGEEAAAEKKEDDKKEEDDNKKEEDKEKSDEKEDEKKE